MGASLLSGERGKPQNVDPTPQYNLSFLCDKALEIAENVEKRIATDENQMHADQKEKFYLCSSVPHLWRNAFLWILSGLLVTEASLFFAITYFQAVG